MTRHTANRRDCRSSRVGVAASASAKRVVHTGKSPSSKPVSPNVAIDRAEIVPPIAALLAADTRTRAAATASYSVRERATPSPRHSQ